MARRRRLGRVVVDTSVVIRAARAFRQQPPEPNTPELKLVLTWRDDPEVFTWLYTREILAEYREILRRLKVPRNAAGRFINLLGQSGEEATDPATGEFSPDPKDDPFYHCALGGDAVDNIIDRGFTVLIGDASGTDTCVQKLLAEKAYANALVFCTGACRNNAGGWKTIVVSANTGERGFDFYALKDREMAKEADYGFMVWDGRSKGTLNNVLNLLSENKRALVFFSPEESFHTICNAEDLSSLLAKCSERALAIFEERLGLSKRLSSFRGLAQGSA